MRVPPRRRKHFPIGAVLQALLARVLGLKYFEGFRLCVPDVFAEG